ncbi:MAG: MBL fold metallo-hydrolase [Patescibacteria group bacterium]|jgi:L-ascorbate metabolism protein UlaG (beta-lactamase superfamily)
MYLTWLGLNSFKIQTSDCTLFTDPYGIVSGLKFPRSQADVVTVSQPENPLANNLDGVSGTPYRIVSPGEYEVKKIFIRGIADAGVTLFYFEVENVSIAHIAALKHPLTSEQLETFEDVDVLLVPAGNPKAVEVDQAVKLISQIEPRLVVPMFYKIPGLKSPAEPLQPFLKAMGGQTPESLPKLKLIKRDLPQSETKVVVLTP